MINKLSRRGFLLGAGTLVASGCMPAARQSMESLAFKRTGVSPRYRRQRVRYDGIGAPGTIVVDTTSRFLFFVEGDGWFTPTPTMQEPEWRSCVA